MLSNPRILIAEDESGIADTLQYVLRTDGFVPVWCPTAAQAIAQFAAEPPALAILDVGLPDMNGFELFKRLQALPGGAQVPMLFLTARSDEIDRVVGLELGADDYIAKPFSPNELVARVRALLRRTQRQPETRDISYGPIHVDTERHVVSSAGAAVALTAKEFLLLQYLLRHRGRVLSRDVLLTDVWGYKYTGGTRTVDVHVRRLREKLPALGDALVTVKQFGYKLLEDPPAV